ncbi:MAG: cytochrome P450 [Acidimicrobiia bacterium]
MTRTNTLADVDILSHDVYAQGIPHTEFRRLRQEAPVSWHNEPAPNSGFWAITRWDDLVDVHRDYRTFSSEIGGTELEELDSDALETRRTMLETDPPRHTELRKIVNPSFSRRAVATHEDTTRTIVRQILDEAAALGEFDFVEEVARALPIRMLSHLLGVPHDDAPRLFEWADAIIYHADPDFTDVIFDRDDTDPYRLLPFRSPFSLEVFSYVDKLATARRRHPAGDVTSILVGAEVEGEPLTDQELNTFFLLLLIAGNETTRHSLSQGVLAFTEYPDQAERLRTDPSLMPTATEEILRWACPQIHFRRTATVDTEIRGVEIKAGDKVVTWYLSANYDEEVFSDPYNFDVGRKPNRHVTFGGGGPHLCLGNWLARLEVRVFFEELLGRGSQIEIAGKVERVRSNFINGIKRLPVRIR